MDNMDGALDYRESIDDKDGEIYGGIGLGEIDVTDVDMLRGESENDKEGICQTCHSNNYVAEPGPTPQQEDRVLWVSCDRCEKWYHAPCVGIDAHTFDENKEWYCCEPNAEEE